MSDSLADQLATTALYGGNADFIEDLYQRFLKDPLSVDPTWAAYFKDLKRGPAGEVDHRQIRKDLSERLVQPGGTGGAGRPLSDVASAKQAAVSRLIQIYANRGHLIANLDPLGLAERIKPYVLDLDYFGLSDADLDT
jgi:2-oxoglutarate dehydrogenase E1 component